MSLSSRLLQLALLCCSAACVYGTYYLANNNGTFDFMRKLREKGPHYLPSTVEPIRRQFTGIEAIDEQLAILSVFFWPMVDGSHAAASIQVLNFSGQFAAAYALVVLEGARNGNKGRIVSYVMIWGLLYQRVAYGITIPITLAVHLSTSPTVSPLSKTVLADAAEVISIPLSIAIGYFIPAKLMTLPFPAAVTSDLKQIYMAIWQVFPVSVTILQQFFKRLLGSASTTLSRSSPRTTVWCLRLTYAFIMLVAGSTHVASLSLATSPDFLATLPDRDSGVYQGLKEVFVPSAYLASQKLAGIGDGAFLFLQYDEYTGSIAVLLWSVFMLARGWPAKSSAASNLVALVLGPLALLTTGPVGCSALLLWLRDELIVESSAGDAKKTK